jgi:pyruvate/2-oxoglutarate dehydrogenase complex dihydrolipoamide acyltransferase (E2) component
MIAKMSKMATDGNFAIPDHNDDVPIDDNISVNSNELAALDHDDMDDEEMLRMLEGDMGDDDELKAFMDDGEGSDFDMDDPKALEKLEAAAAAPRPKPKPTQAQKPAETQQQPQAKPQQPQASTVQAAPAPKPTAATAVPVAVSEHTLAKKLTTAEIKIRNDEYDVLIKNVNDNIKDVTNFMNRQKDPAMQQKYLPLIKQSEGYLKTLNDAKKAQEPVPPYKFVQLTAKREKTNADIGQDDIKVTLVNMINVKSTAKYSIKFILQLGKEQTQTSKQVKGKDIVEFNQDLKFTMVPANIRGSQNGIKILKLGRASVELHSHGMFFGSTVIGKGDLKISPLQTKCEHNQTVKIKDDDGEVIAELEVNLAINRPFVTPELEETVINIVKMGAAAPAPELKPIAPAQTTAATTTKSAPAAAATTTKPTPAAAAAPVAAAATKEKDPDEMSPAEVVKATGFGLSIKVYNTLGEYPPFVGLEALTHEVATCTQMLKTKQFKRRMGEYECQDRISDSNLRKTVLEAQVGSGKLTLPQYIILLREQIEYEVKLEEETIKIARWYKSKDKIDDARYYAELVAWFKTRKEVTKKELEGAESMGDDDEDDEEE